MCPRTAGAEPACPVTCDAMASRSSASSRKESGDRSQTRSTGRDRIACRRSCRRCDDDDIRLLPEVAARSRAPDAPGAAGVAARQESRQREPGGLGGLRVLRCQALLCAVPGDACPAPVVPVRVAAPHARVRTARGARLRGYRVPFTRGPKACVSLSSGARRLPTDVRIAGGSWCRPSVSAAIFSASARASPLAGLDSLRRD